MSSIVERKGPYGQFMLFGDSLTQQSASQEKGFAFMPALQDHYIRRLDVINRGFSGYNTNQALGVLPSFMPKRSQAKVCFMTIFFGANDACLKGSPSGQHVPLDKYIQNLEAILHHPTIQEHKPKLILITPPPIDEHLYSQKVTDGTLPSASRTAQNTKHYADACRELGSTKGIAVLDLWSAFIARTGWKPEDGEDKLPGSRSQPESAVLKELLSDGLHFNPPAYRIMYEDLTALIKSRWPEDSPDNIDFVFPPWQDFYPLKAPSAK